MNPATSGFVLFAAPFFLLCTFFLSFSGVSLSVCIWDTVFDFVFYIQMTFEWCSRCGRSRDPACAWMTDFWIITTGSRDGLRVWSARMFRSGLGSALGHFQNNKPFPAFSSCAYLIELSQPFFLFFFFNTHFHCLVLMIYESRLIGWCVMFMTVAHFIFFEVLLLKCKKK